MNQYLARLRTLNSEKGDTCSPDKTDKTPPATGFVGFVSSSGSPFSEIGAPGRKPLPRLDPVPRPTVPTTYARMYTALHARCPDHIEPARWQQAAEDGRRFLAQWGEQAEALGWTARDLFGLHEVPANPHPRYQRLSRYDCTGLIWLLKSCPVVALTEATAAIKMPTGSILTYRKFNKPTYAPLGNSIDDFK